MEISDLVAGPPIGCSADTSLVDAASKMIAEGIGSLVVLDGDRLAGIITDRDIVRSAADNAVAGRKVGDVMTPDPDTVESDIGIDEAVEWLNATGYRHLPVAEDGKLKGIVSSKDLLWAIADANLGNVPPT